MTKQFKNILVSSAGRRVELVKAFQVSLQELGIDAKVLATDMAPVMSSACQVSDDCFQVPAATEQEYVDFLIDLCLANEVGLLIPTIDTELKCLSENKNSFSKAGVQVAISDPAFIDTCRDKRRTGEFFKNIGIDYPEIYPRDEIQFPCFCKPYDGSRSIGAKKIFSPSEISQCDLENPKNIFMELISDQYCEYTVDGYYGMDGNLYALVCRERLEVRSGEVSKGIARKDFVYDYLVPKLKSLPDARGCITFQFFVNKETQDIKGLEVNPRFGGGYPLTHKAGARFTDYLVSEYLMSQNLDFYDDWEDSLLMLRYDAGIYKKYAD